MRKKKFKNKREEMMTMVKVNLLRNSSALALEFQRSKSDYL